MRKAFISLLLLVPGSAHAAAPTHACAPASSTTNDIVATLQAMYTAIRTDDAAALRTVTTADFYAYDAGARFTGESLLQLIAQAHAAGKTFEWSVTQPLVHAACDSAWVTYVNRGAIEDATGRQALTWLESAVLEYDGRWRIHFLHATRTPTPLPQAASRSPWHPALDPGDSCMPLPSSRRQGCPILVREFSPSG